MFAGDETNRVPRYTQSVEIWQKLFSERGVSGEVAEIGSEAAGGERGMKDGERIFYYDASKNWWSRAGTPEKMPIGEIGGPDSEVFYDFGTEHDPRFGEHCHPNCDCGRFLEIGNSVFMEYVKTEAGFEKLPKQNVDFGGGLERITAAANNDGDVFTIDLLWPLIAQMETASGTTYASNQVPFRVIADHLRGAVFMIGDGVEPSNTEQGYFVRRLLRRSVRFADVLGVPPGTLRALANTVIDSYQEHYTTLDTQRERIVSAIEKEEQQFRTTLEKGMKVLTKYIEARSLTAENAFVLFTTYGFPYELTEELAAEHGITLDKAAFTALMAEHQAQSRAGAEQKFKGGLADHGEKTVQYHTATHLLLAALRHFLGNHVHQAGSNITGERLRFDFTHEEKLTPEQLQDIEDWVNAAIKTGGTVTTETMAKSAAEADPSVEGSFWDRYPDEVKVYTITGNDGTVFSRELCGGPHVTDLSEISGTFRIKKEESSSAGVRRIKAVL